MSDDVANVTLKEFILISNDKKNIQYLGIPVVDHSFGHRASVVYEYEKVIEKFRNKNINQNDV